MQDKRDFQLTFVDSCFPSGKLRPVVSGEDDDSYDEDEIELVDLD